MSQLNSKIRVLIADDHELFRDGFSVFIEDQPDMELAGVAKDGKELVEMSATLNPDVILTDVQMPIMDGAEAVIHLAKHQPEIPVIAMSSYADDYTVSEMLTAGVRGYLLKHAHKRDIIEAVHAVQKGGIWYCREISEAMLRHLQNEKKNEEKYGLHDEGDCIFGQRDLQIIRMICQQKSNKEMATALDLSVRTVESRRIGIFHKMNVRTPAGVVLYAMNHGLFNPDDPTGNKLRSH